MAAKFDIETKNGFLLIRCDDMIHLMVERPVAIQSWITDEEQEKYCIEYTSSGGHEVLTEYNKRAKWEQLLALLDSHLFGDAALQTQA